MVSRILGLMRKIYLSKSGVVTGKKTMAPPPPKKPSLKQDDQNFLDALKVLLDEQRRLLVEELGEKISSIPVAVQTENSTMVRHLQPSKPVDFVEIDESIFVTEQKLDDIEKGFEELAETKTTKDEEASKSISKLRDLKKGKS